MTLTETRPHAGTQPRVSSAGLRVFAALTGLTSLAILLQAVIAGAFVDKQGKDNLITAHGVVADISWVLALITTIVGWRVLRSRAPRLVGWSALLFVLTLSQTGIGHLITDNGKDALIVVHVPLAMLIFGLTVWLSLQASMLRRRLGTTAT